MNEVTGPLQSFTVTCKPAKSPPVVFCRGPLRLASPARSFIGQCCRSASFHKFSLVHLGCLLVVFLVSPKADELGISSQSHEITSHGYTRKSGGCSGGPAIPDFISALVRVSIRLLVPSCTHSRPGGGSHLHNFFRGSAPNNSWGTMFLNIANLVV